jgi:hypothetical protein
MVVEVLARHHNLFHETATLIDFSSSLEFSISIIDLHQVVSAREQNPIEITNDVFRDWDFCVKNVMSEFRRRKY